MAWSRPEQVRQGTTAQLEEIIYMFQVVRWVLLFEQLAGNIKRAGC